MFVLETFCKMISKILSSRRHVIYLFLFILVSGLTEYSNGNLLSAPGIKNKNLVVWFDPFVSIKDGVQPEVYTEVTLLPLLEKVGSRFSQILIHITENELDENKWNTKALDIVARLNSLKLSEQNTSDSTTAPYLRIWISFHYIRASFEDNHNVIKHMAKLTEICAKANSIFPGTIYALTIHLNGGVEDKTGFAFLQQIMKILHDSREKLPLIQQYKLGLMYDLFVCRASRSSVVDFEPLMKGLVRFTEIVFFDAITNLGSKHLTGLNKIDESIHWLSIEAKQCRNLLERVYHGKHFQMGIYTGWADTQTNGNVNYTSLVYYWQTITKKGLETDTTYIMDRAFDTPYSFYILEETKGWWRLKESTNYKDPRDYIFEEKLELAREKASSRFEKINTTWLQTPISFNADCVGVSMFSDVSKHLNVSDQNIAKSLIRKVAETFKILMLRSENLITDDQEFSQNSSVISILKSATEVNLESERNFLPILLSFESFSNNVTYEVHKLIHNYIKPINLLAPGTVTSLLFRLDKNIDWENELQSISQLLGTNIFKNSSLSLGIGLPLRSWCLQENNLSLPLQNLIDNLAIVIDVNWIRLNANTDQLIQQLIILMDICNKRVDIQLKSIYAEKSPKIMFIIDWTDINLTPTELYKLINFVKFWEALNIWANTQNNITIILGDAFDSMPNSGQAKLSGWWDIKLEFSNANFENKLSFEDKKKSAFKLYEDELNSQIIKSTSKLEATDMLTIVFASLGILVFIITFQVYIWRRSRRFRYVTKEEHKAFFNGMINTGRIKQSIDSQSISTAEPMAAPYQKAKYEIRRSHFIVDDDDDAQLGNGEFGRVCRGRIFRDGGQSIQVAVKMAKYPPKSGTIAGLLSEIKVLSYIGKHDNIVELLGANTADIYKGIVYIFLELCHFGSLHKYLTTISTNDTEIVSDDFGETIKHYENKQKCNRLDPCLSSEFARWALEIAKGMKFLASKHVVHADLATRNVLININRQAKISDFGLSRRMYNYQCYVKAGAEPLPWRWMAPESLRFSKFTEKTDVWAYGITLWEIYSLGETPYSGTSWSVKFSTHLEKGLRLTEPRLNEKSM